MDKYAENGMSCREETEPERMLREVVDKQAIVIDALVCYVVSLKSKASVIAGDLERVSDLLKQHETEMKNGGKNGK